jgi:hypothetical protein
MAIMALSFGLYFFRLTNLLKAPDKKDWQGEENEGAMRGTVCSKIGCDRMYVDE